MKLSYNTLYTTPIMFYSSLYLNVCTFSIFAAFYKVWIIQYIKTFEWVLSIDLFRNGLNEVLSTFIRFFVITIFVMQRINIDFEWLSDFVAVCIWITFYYKNTLYEKICLIFEFQNICISRYHEKYIIVRYLSSQIRRFDKTCSAICLASFQIYEK